MNGIGKRAALVCATAAIGVTVFASVAFAATTVLQPGQTTAVGMSGTCTDCHAYAAAPSAPAPTAPQVIGSTGV